MDLSHLTAEQQHYVRKRLRQIRWWNRLGWLLIVALAVAIGWVWQKHPLYLDPMQLMTKLRAGQVSDIEIARLAAMGNLAFIGCGLMFFALVILTYAAMWTESHTIHQLLGKPAQPAANNPPEPPTHDDPTT